MARVKFYRPFFYYFLVATRAFFLLWPVSFAYAFAGALGRLIFRSLPKERAKTLAHLRMAFPERSEKELTDIGRACFVNYGYILAELAMVDKLIPQFPKIVSVTGREHFDRALAAGKGLIAVTAHFGNWEFLGGALSLLGYPGSVIARRIYYDKYDKMLVDIRTKMKLKNIYRDDSPREVLKALKDNRVLGVLADQDIESIDGVFVDFFGRKAFTPSAPAKLAAKTGAALIPLMIIRDGKRHEIHIHPPVVLQKTDDEEKDTIANTQAWVNVQEDYIRRYPHLWVWNHKRWKTR